METIVNKFSLSLKGLFDEAKISARKNWSKVLGVSEAALSQWTKGQSMPQPRHIETIIKLSRNSDLTEYQKFHLDSLICSLETPLENTRPNGQKIADYLIKDRLENLEYGLSSLFYDLQVELSNQYLREIQIIRTDLEEKLCDIKEGDSTEKRIEAFEKATHCFRNKSYRMILDEYVASIKEVHLEYNENLKKNLKSSNRIGGKKFFYKAPNFPGFSTLRNCKNPKTLNSVSVLAIYPLCKSMNMGRNKIPDNQKTFSINEKLRNNQLPANTINNLMPEIK